MRGVEGGPSGGRRVAAAWIAVVYRGDGGLWERECCAQKWGKGGWLYRKAFGVWAASELSRWLRKRKGHNYVHETLVAIWKVPVTSTS